MYCDHPECRKQIMELLYLAMKDTEDVKQVQLNVVKFLREALMIDILNGEDTYESIGKCIMAAMDAREILYEFELFEIGKVKENKRVCERS